ncbi:hypothetical protein [Kribbella turkmenica]|nr:hypothetical protein [Kribbella turkmenica]
MSSDRPGPEDQHREATPDEVPENDERRPPRQQDVTSGDEGQPVEPPD